MKDNGFRFIHAADLHLDSPMEGLDSYEGAPVEALRGATRRAFENLVRLAIEEAVDFMLIAGDLYDQDWRDYGTGLFFVRQMARLRAAGIPVYLVAGNHDAASVLTRRLSLPDNVHLFSNRACQSVEVPGRPAVVHGRSFPNRTVPENLVPEYPTAVSHRFNIGLLHTSLSGAEGHNTYAPCQLRDLTKKKYQYWALGHVHQPQVVSENPWVVFAGNLQGRNVRETGARGCRLVAVSDSLEVQEARFVPLDEVRWAVRGVDLAGARRETDALRRIGDCLRAAAEEAEDRLLAVRLHLHGATHLHGRLHRELPRFREEARAQGLAAGEAVWVEEMKVQTAPLQDPAELAMRDELTRVVLDTLDGGAARGLDVPGDVEEMLQALPVEVREEAEAEIAEANRAGLLDDVRAIILEALAAKGGENE